jgi:hypothetical protein
VGAAYEESQQPDDKYHDGDPPQKVNRESHAEEKQCEQKNNEQRSHGYQPPGIRLPLIGVPMRRIRVRLAVALPKDLPRAELPGAPDVPECGPGSGAAPARSPARSRRMEGPGFAWVALTG